MTPEIDTVDCKGCMPNVRVTQESIDRVLADILRDGSLTLVSDDEYARRLEICTQCDHYCCGSTCMICGCFVQIRAKIAQKHCALPGAAKW